MPSIKELDWDQYGFPGQFIYSDDCYIDDYYMDERWKQVRDFPDYWVSDKGRLWSNISHDFVKGTPTGSCGHIDVSIRYGRERHHRYLHRLVAEAFIPNPNDYPIVRHLDDDPQNNCVDNLEWGTQTDNMRDAISNGTFVFFSDKDRELAMQKCRAPVIAARFEDGKLFYFESQQEAARQLNVNQADISSVILGKRYGAKGYYFEIDDGPIDVDKFYYAKNHYVGKNNIIIATNEKTGETLKFRGLTDAANYIGVSISAISMVINKKMKSTKGWIFERIGGVYDE